MADSDVTPFRVEVPQATLDDLDDRLRRTRWPADPDNETGRFGASRLEYEALVHHWLDVYDWRAVEAELNAVPTFRATVDDQVVHFVHVRGNGPAPFPLVLTHGYPWTYWDYRHVIAPLTDPAAHGGDPADAFDVVVPSIPGYGFSVPMRAGGMSARKTANLWTRLMRDVLGAPRFGAAGGDWGAAISILLGHLHPDEVAGIYVTLGDFAPALRNRFEPFDVADLNDEERVWYDAHWQRKPRAGDASFSGPAVLMRTPMNDAYAGHDSPLALAIAIGESRHMMSDHQNEVEHVVGVDDVLTNVMLYWVTEAWASARRFYWYTVRDAPTVPDDGRLAVPVPTGLGAFPADVFYVARAVAERDANIVQWDLNTAGGHVAAAEEPTVLVEALRRFFRPLR